MNTLLNSFLFGHTFSAVEFFSEAETTRMAFIKVKKTGAGLKINTKQVFDEEDKLKKLDVKDPIVLIVNTNQVLIKEIEVQDLNEKKILFKAFPNINADEFYYEIWQYKQRAIIAITRKEYLNSLISLYKKFRFSGVFLGINALSNFTDFELPTPLFTNTLGIDLNGVSLLFNHEKKSQMTYTINGIDVESEYLNTFSGILRIFISKKTLGNLNELDLHISEKFVQESFFRKSITTGILILLVLLLLNFVFFDYYYRRVQQEDATAQLKTTENALINRLQKQIKRKEIQLKDFEYNSNRPYAGIISKIVEDMPLSILLDEITINPLKKKVKEGEPVTVVNNQIIIKGTAQNTVAFTNWIKKIQDYSVVVKIKIVSFYQEENTGNKFSISIQLKDETQ